jgi:hypothetical protein
MMRRAAMEAVEQQLGRPDLAEALGGWMEQVEKWVSEGLMRDGQFRSMIEAVEKRLCRIEGGVQQHLKQHGRRGEQQMGRVVEAVTQMRDEMKGMRVGQGEMGRLVKGMGKGVLDAETKLSGLGSTVRAIQRELASRAQADKRLADQVDQLRRQGAVMGQAVRAGMVGEGGQLAAESGGQQTSPPDTVRKQMGMGRRMGGVSGRQLQFGSGTEEHEVPIL